MVSAFQMPPFYSRASTIETSLPHHSKFGPCDDDDGILDDNILDHGVDSALEMSPPLAESRRDSFAIGPHHPLFSPKTEDWGGVDMQSVPSSSNPFLDGQTSNNPFMRMDPAQAAVYGAAAAAHHQVYSGACTPMGPFDGMTADFEAAAAAAAGRAHPSIFSHHQRAALPAQSPFGPPPHMATANNIFGLSAATPGPSLPSSPQKDWVPMHQQFPQLQQQAASGRKTSGSLDSPVIRSHNEMRRGDGIRKKNARFEIPAERNLSNIDYLIAQSKDEQEIKELKQQKRLLRNRQAALDSRQRKKQHTERLEDEKKQFTIALNEMEEEMQDLRTRMEQLMREKVSCMEYIDGMNHEKEELIRAHTIETGELRKKVSVLTEHVHRLEGGSGGMMAATGSGHGHGGYQTYDEEMGGMSLGAGPAGPWDGCGAFLGDYQIEPEIKQEPPQLLPLKRQTEMLQSTSSGPTEMAMDKPAAGQSGLLFMLFLVGAFVLSSRSMPAIPRVSEDVRAASATLLESVLKDHGVAAAAAASAMGAVAPQPSGWADVPAAMIGMAPQPSAGSALGELGDALTQPTREQKNEQLFSMSAAQYNGVNSQDFLQNPPPERSTSQGRRNLADALAGIRNGGGGGGGDKQQDGAAEVYTRSLLWDQIPSQVVRDFAKMMAECNNNNKNNGNQQDEQQCSEAVTTTAS